MANDSTPPRLKSETVVKFAWPKYEQKYKMDYVFKCIPKFSTEKTRVFCTIFRCDLSIIFFNRAHFYTLQVQKHA